VKKSRFSEEKIIAVLKQAEAGEMHERIGELCGVTALLAVHTAPRGDDVPGLLGVIVYGRLGVSRGVVTEQFRASPVALRG